MSAKKIWFHEQLVTMPDENKVSIVLAQKYLWDRYIVMDLDTPLTIHSSTESIVAYFKDWYSNLPATVSWLKVPKASISHLVIADSLGFSPLTVSVMVRDKPDYPPIAAPPIR